MDIKTEVGKRIAFSRKSQWLTLGEVEKRSKTLKKSTISNYENGNRMPGIQEILELSQALNVSPSYLACFDQDVDFIRIGKRISDLPNKLHTHLISEVCIFEELAKKM